MKWSPSGRIFATAGNDRKVKLWEVANCELCGTFTVAVTVKVLYADRAQSKGMLTGSNAGIMSIDFDTEVGADNSSHFTAYLYPMFCRSHYCWVLPMTLLVVFGVLMTRDRDTHSLVTLTKF